MRKIKKIEMIGIILMLTALVINPILIGQLLTADKHIDSWYKFMLILFFECFLFLVGLALYTQTSGRQQSRKKMLLVFLNIILIVLSAAFYIKLDSDIHNPTLYENGNWISTKVGLEKGVVGAVAFFVTKVALVRDNLNIGAWHGFQEIIYKDKINPSFAEFDFLLSKNSHLSFIFNKDAAGFSGIRIGNDPDYENMYFTAGPDGEFKSKNRLNISNIKADRWNHFRMEFSGSNPSIYLNGLQIGRLDVSDAPILSSQLIGFRGSMNYVFIDNILIEDAHSGRTISEKFGKIRITAISISLIMIQLIIILFFIIFSKRDKNHLFILFETSLMVFLIFTFACGYYAYIYSGQYPTNPNRIDWKGFKTNIEDGNAVIDKIRLNYDADNIKGNYRIMFIGTSQTWGAGASQDNMTFVRRAERMLNAGSKTEYELINVGISGSTSDRLIYLYKSELMKLRPNMTIIDLSNNDFDLKNFSRNLEEFVSLNNQNHVKTIFLLEPNVLGGPGNARLVEKHSIMRQVALRHNLTVIDMHAYLIDKHDAGFIWWDLAHLTDFGQKLFADRLYSEITGGMKEAQGA